jgi:hypothetical protein
MQPSQGTGDGEFLLFLVSFTICFGSKEYLLFLPTILEQVSSIGNSCISDKMKIIFASEHYMGILYGYN